MRAYADEAYLENMGCLPLEHIRGELQQESLRIHS